MENFNLDLYDLHKNYSLEASAGAGKTFSVIEIVVKLLKQGIPLEKILIVTYTEKATGELKNRLRKRIDELQLTDVNIDNNQIYTMHGFCKKTIDEYYILLKSSSTLNLASDNDLLNFLNSYVRDNETLRDELKNYDASSINTFVRKIKSCINSYYLNSLGKEDPKIAVLDKRCLVQTKDDLYQTFDLLDDYLKLFAAADVKRCQNFAADVIEASNNGRIDFNGSRYNARLFPEDYLEAFNYIKAIKDFQSKFTSIHYLVAYYLPTIYQAWQEEKAKKNMQTFNDMLRTMREALLEENSALRSILTEKYQYGIIDEFQDTNQLQWDIFSNMFLKDELHHLIVVGDPKQSIYSFQGADVEVYQQAVKQLASSGGLKRNLPYNWRASCDIIDACNNIFSNEFFKTTGISFIPPKSPDNNKKKATFDAKPLKPVWLASDIKSIDFGKYVAQSIIDCTTFENGKTRLQISDDGITRDVTYNDFVVLAKVRSEFTYIERALKQYGIPYIKYKDVTLFTSNECKEWIILFRCLSKNDLTGKNIKYFKEALFTKFFNKSLYEISNLMDVDIESSEIQKIIHWQELASKKYYEDLIDDILIESGMMEEQANSTFISSNAKYKQIGKIALNYLMKNHTLEDLVNYLHQKARKASIDEDYEEDDDIVERDTNLASVKLMTMHASKGLEFPVVIMASSFGKSSDKSDCFYYRNEKNQKVLTLKTDNNKNAKFNFEEAMRLFYVALTRAKYLLMIPIYQDATSGDYSPHLKQQLVNFVKNPENQKYYQLMGELDNVAKYRKIVSDTIKCLSEKEQKGRKETEEEVRTRLQKVITAITEHRTNKYSYSSLTHAHEEVIIGDTLNLDKEGSSEAISLSFDNNPKWFTNLEYSEKVAPIAISPNYPKGAIIGTALHEIMEKLDFTTKDNDTINQLIKQVMAYYGYENEVWLTDTKELVDSVLAAKLPIINGSSFNQEYFCLNSIDAPNKLAEVEFNFNKENEFLKDYFTGFIDLIIRRGDYYSVLDWKSDTLNDEEFDSYAKPASLKAHVDERYAIQRVLYSYVLIKWLKLHYPEKTEEDIFNNHFGGVYYVFLKGCNKGLSNGIYAQTWENYHELEAEYQKIIQLIGGKK